MLCGMEQKIVVDPNGDFTAFAACGNQIWSMNFTDLERINVVAGSCKTCTCCDKYALEFKMTDEGFEKLKEQMGCWKCCVDNPTVKGLMEIDELIIDLGIVTSAS